MKSALRSILILVFGICLLGLANISHAAIYRASASGSLDFDADGKTTKVIFSETVGESIRSALIQEMNQWEFVPIKNSAGQAVPATTFFVLSLSAEFPKDSNAAVVKITDTRFHTGNNQNSMEKPEGQSHVRRVPEYPFMFLREGIGGELIMMIDIDEQGSAKGVTLEQAWIYAPKGRTKKQLNVYRMALEKVSSEFLRQRQYPKQINTIVRISVEFKTESQYQSFWTHAYKIDLPANIIHDPQKIVTMTADGQSVSSNIVLKTKLVN